MHAIHKATARQCNAISAQAGSADAHAFFNLLTGPELFDVVELALPPHRERVFPPTETLSMFLAQALSTDRSCQRAVNERAIKHLVTGLTPCSTHTGAYCRARQRVPTRADADGQHFGPSHRAMAGGPRPSGMALARSSRTIGRWGHSHHARYDGQSSGLPATGQPEAWIGIPAMPDRGADLPGQRCRA